MCAQTTKSSEREQDTFFNIRIKPSLLARIRELAAEHERTLGAEIRVAISEYVEQQAQAA